jgi:hypothetical protein
LTNLVNYIAKTARTVELHHVKAILGDPKSPRIAEHSVDVVFDPIGISTSSTHAKC